MNRLLLFALLFTSRSFAAHAQSPAARLDSTAQKLSVQKFQQGLNDEFRSPTESPLTLAERRAFNTLPFYPTQYDYYVEATLVRDSTSAPFAMKTSTARRPLYRKYGELRFELKGQALKLTAYQNQELLTRPGFENYLFVPFTDLTNGHESYGGGRYIDLRIPPAGATVMQLDFNQAYNPSCAYNHGYSCPVPPAENRLAVAIPVGVQDGHSYEK